MNFIPLTPLDVGVAGLLLLINAGLSIWLQLGMARVLLVNAVRMVVQLSLVALVLKTLFATVSPWLTAGVALIMVLFAGREAMARQTRHLTGWWGYGLGTTAMFFAGLVVTLFALTTQVQPDPWYHPRYAIPLLGMILGNCMIGVSLGLGLLLSRAARERVAVEAMPADDVQNVSQI